MSPAEGGTSGQRRPISWSLALTGIIALLAFAGCGDREEPIVLTVSPSATPAAEVAGAAATSDSTTATEAETSQETPASTATDTEDPSATASETEAPTITQSPTEPEPTATPTATSTPAPSPTATETPVPPTPTVAEGSVAIVEIIYDPIEGLDGDGETVYITNQSDQPIDMTGWTLSDIAEHIFVFPEFTLQPGSTVGVNICIGENSAEMLYWERCSAVWNNDGDTAYLHDATGREIHVFSYVP